jgi:hypothetical protein
VRKGALPKRRSGGPFDALPLYNLPESIRISCSRISDGSEEGVPVHGEPAYGVPLLRVGAAYILPALWDTFDLLARRLAG